MLAGGLGNIRESHIEKHRFPAGTPLVVLGGPAMLIGLGGGAVAVLRERERAGAPRGPGDVREQFHFLLGGPLLRSCEVISCSLIY